MARWVFDELASARSTSKLGRNNILSRPGFFCRSRLTAGAIAHCDLLLGSCFSAEKERVREKVVRGRAQDLQAKVPEGKFKAHEFKAAEGFTMRLQYFAGVTPRRVLFCMRLYATCCGVVNLVSRLWFLPWGSLEQTASTRQSDASPGRIDRAQSEGNAPQDVKERG